MDASRKPIFFTSDWHIGHANVLKYDSRPFKDLDHMHRHLINTYNATVPANGICYFLGDVGYTKHDIVGEVMRQMHGTKVIILGNHDKGAHSMYAQGFDVVLNAAIFYIGQHRISMSHCPLPGIFREDVTTMASYRQVDKGNMWHGEHKNQMFTSQDLTVDFHLHGHIHSDGVDKPRSTDRQFDVGVRANKYRPVSISEIEAWIAGETKKDIEGRE